MPEGLSGRELAARLQASDPGLKVVFTSGYSVDIAGRELTLEVGQTSSKNRHRLSSCCVL